jgi:N-acetylneuraminic acid mutarotase
MRVTRWIPLTLLLTTVAACSGPVIQAPALTGLASANQRISRSGWQPGSPMTTVRYHMASGLIGGKLVTAGGISQRLHNETEAYDPATGTWTSLAPMPTERYFPASGVIGRQLYVAGGWNFGAIDTVEAFDAEANTWQSLPALPEALLGAGSAVLAGELHVLGGTRQGALFDTHYIYNPKARKWRKEAPLPFKRAAMAVATVDDRIYCWGGWDKSSDVPPASGAMYEGKTGRWSPLPAMPASRVLPAVAASGSRIFVMGGGGDTGMLERTTLIFDTERRTWSQGPDMAAYRNGSSAAVVGRQLLVAGEGLGDETPSLETLDLGQALTPGTAKPAGKRIRYSKPDWLLR